MTARRDRRTILFQLVIHDVFLFFVLDLLKLKSHPDQSSVTLTTSYFNPLFGGGGGGPISFNLSSSIANKVASNIRGGWVQNEEPRSFKFPDPEKALADAINAAGQQLGHALLSMSEFLITSLHESYQSRMAEQFYTVVSDTETSGEDKQQSSFPDLATGIDIGTSQCSVAIWNGSKVELLRNTRNQKLMRSYVMFKDETPSCGVSEELAHDEQEIFSRSAIFNMKCLVGRTDKDPVVHASKTLPFMVQTLDIGVRPFIATLVNNVRRSATPEEVLAIFLVELKATAEVQFKQPVRNVVLTILVLFSRFQQTRIEHACAMAGLHVLRLMLEPTAVALLYAQQQ